jgi:hypothetical protein
VRDLAPRGPRAHAREGLRLLSGASPNVDTSVLNSSAQAGARGMLGVSEGKQARAVDQRLISSKTS